MYALAARSFSMMQMITINNNKIGVKLGCELSMLDVLKQLKLLTARVELSVQLVTIIVRADASRCGTSLIRGLLPVLRNGVETMDFWVFSVR